MNNAANVKSIVLTGLMLGLGMISCVACNHNVENQASIQVAKASQAMFTGMDIASKLVFEAEFSQREPNPNATVGALLYDRYCSSCHNNGSKAPPIKGNYATSPSSESDFYIIRYGLNEMRGFSTRLTDFQILDVLAYLEEEANCASKR